MYAFQWRRVTSGSIEPTIHPIGEQTTSKFCLIIRSRGAVWSARRPVKAEVAGSNPVGTATNFFLLEKEICGGRVAQLAERPPEKR